MPIDSLPGDLMSIGQVAKSLPTRPNTATVWRWCSRGVRGYVLPTVKVGGRTYVSQAALEIFINRLNDPSKSSLSADRSKSKRDAEKYLAENGL